MHITPSQTVSIVIPTRYSRDSLIATLHSIRSQTRAPIYVLADHTRPSTHLLRTMRKMDVSYEFIAGEHTYLEKLTLLLKKVDTPYVIVSSDDVHFGKDIVVKTQEEFANNSKITAIGYAIFPCGQASTLVHFGLSWMIRVINSLSNKWNAGDNYLSLSGRGFALRTSHVVAMRIPKEVINSDAFLYFENKQCAGAFAKIVSSAIYITVPRSLKDQLGPSSRYQFNTSELARYFPAATLRQLHVPKRILFEHALISFLQQPMGALAYLCIFVITRLYVWYGFDQDHRTNFWASKG